VDSKRITQEDADLIRAFVQEVRSTSRKISASRIYKLTVTLISLREYFPKPFADSTINDLYAAREMIETAQKADSSPRYRQNTIADFIRFMKRFFVWMTENKHSAVSMKNLEKISPPAYRYDTKTADMIFDKEEIHAMLKACQNSRDRAIIACLYDGALRVGELGTLRWHQVQFTDWDATLTIRYKTEKIRTVPLFMAREYLAAWRNDYPGEPSGDNYVFLTANGGGKRTGHNQLQYAGVAKQIRKIAERAGITKKITPHLFRHSRITHCIQDGMQESMIKLLAWGHTTTGMLDKCYSHVGPSDVKREMARIAGVQIEDTTRSKVLEPRQCPRCGMINGPTLEWCSVCGLELTAEAREKVKIATEQAEALPEYKMLLQRMEEMQKEIIALKAVKGTA
jgi:integrase